MDRPGNTHLQCDSGRLNDPCYFRVSTFVLNDGSPFVQVSVCGLSSGD